MADNPKLTVLFEELRGKTFELNKETMSVGRRDTNDICIPHGSLSGHHADIIRAERNGKVSYILRDNNSTNGTRVNNVPVEGEVELKNSDLILFGGVEVLFDGHDASSDRSSYTKSHTIDISGLDSTLTSAPALTNLSPFAGSEDDKKFARNQKIIVGLIIVVSVMLVALLAYVVFKGATLKQNKAAVQQAITHLIG